MDRNRFFVRWAFRELLSPESLFTIWKLNLQEDSGSGIFHRKGSHHEIIGVLSHRQNCGDWNFGSPLIIKDQMMNETSSYSSSMANVTIEDLKMMNISEATSATQGRQLHTLKLSDSVMGSPGDHYYDPLPVFTRIDYHWNWIVENTKDSCYCKPSFQFSINLNKLWSNKYVSNVCVVLQKSSNERYPIVGPLEK